MDLKPKKNKNLTLWIIGVATVCILIYLGVKHIRVLADTVYFCLGMIAPLLIGLALAMILNVPMRFFHSHLWPNAKNKFLQALRNPLAYVISLVIIIGILVGVVWLVIPKLIEAITVIVETVMGYINTLSAMDRTELESSKVGSLLLNTNWDKLLSTAQDWLTNHSGNIVNTAFDTISSLLSGTFDAFISFIFSVYILFSKDKLKSQARRLIKAWLPEKFGNWFRHACTVASENFRNFISGQSLEAVILGMLCMLGMLILGLPYAPMVGALVGVTALIPVIGAFIGAIIGGFMILTVDPMKAIIFLIFIIILQQVEGNLIYPKVMGSRVKLPGLWILTAVTIGGALAGPVGMLLSVPIGSTIYVLIKEATEKREKKLESIAEKLD